MRIEGALSRRGQEFPFVLYRQTESLGSAGTIQYYYMQPSGFRNLRRRKDAQLNFRSCVGCWFAAMHEIGLGEDVYQQQHFVLATSYALVCRNKSLQNMYRDAFLRTGRVDLSQISVSDEEQERIRRVVKSRDRTLLTEALDSVFDAFEPSRGDRLGFEQAVEHWVGNGVNAFRKCGEEGVLYWLNALDTTMSKYRKNSKTGLRVRSFVNFFSYLAKTSFYLCYASFWAALIPWLKENHGLDELSERFMQFWHHQNQPIEIPPGRTASGPLLPVGGEAQLLLPDEEGRFALPRVTWSVPRIGPEVVRDVFSGQVLALHPLTWFLFCDPALSEVAGRYFGSIAPDDIAHRGSAEHSAEYWELIGAILLAGSQYRVAGSQFERDRSIDAAGGNSTVAVQRDDTPQADAFLADFVESRGYCCPCGARLEYSSSIVPRRGQARLCLVCRQCERTRTVKVPEHELTQFLLRDSEDESNDSPGGERSPRV